MRLGRCARTKTLPVEVTKKKICTCYLINVAHKFHTHTHPRLYYPCSHLPTTFADHIDPAVAITYHHIPQTKLGIHYKHRNRMYA